MFLLLALTSLNVAVATSLPGSRPPATGLMLGAAVVMVLAWVHRYRHGDEITRLCWLECLAATVFLLACANPITGTGVVIALVWFRALFGRTAHVACYGVGMSAAVATAALLWDDVPWHADGLPAAMIAALPGVVLTSVVARHLVLGVVERDRAHRCGTLLAERAAQLLAADDLDQVVVPIGAQVLARACADMVSWSDDGHPVAVHVNASAAQLSVPGMVSDVVHGLAGHGLAPDRLVIEVTESSALSTPAVRAAVQELDALGVGIAIDDFGTGYAALSALRELPIDVVKIDESFVTGAATSVADEAVVHAIVEMAHRLGLDTVAEGVETAEQERPVTAADLTAWLRARSSVPVA